MFMCQNSKLEMTTDCTPFGKWEPNPIDVCAVPGKLKSLIILSRGFTVIKIRKLPVVVAWYSGLHMFFNMEKT